MQNYQEPIFDDRGFPIDQVSGEVMTSRNGRELTIIQEPLTAMFENYKPPIQIMKMKEYGVSADVYSSFIGVPWIDVDPYLNKSVKVIGAAAWFSGSFTSNKEKTKGELMPGYYKVLMKIAETVKEDVVIDRQVVVVERHIIIATSAKKVAELMAGFMETYGWFDWPAGTYETVVFSGNKDQGVLARTIGDLHPQVKDKTSAR